MKVIDKFTRHELTRAEILDEINRDRSGEWQNYTMEDFDTMLGDLIYWIDPQYFEVTL